VSCSEQPGAAAPEQPPQAWVRVVVPDPATVEVERLRQLVGTMVPAHVPVVVEVVAQ
jgi:hypothetical protein